MLKNILFVFLVLFSNAAFAVQTAYLPQQRFVALPSPNTKQQNRNQVVSQPAKFFPLNREQIARPMQLSRATTKDMVVAKDASLTPTPAKENFAKNKMSPEQAQQLLSIFNQNK